MPELDNLHTTTEIENYRVEQLKLLQEARKNRNAIRQEKLQVQREIISLQAKKKDLEIAEDKANNIISGYLVNVELARTKYWQVKE